MLSTAPGSRQQPLVSILELAALWAACFLLRQPSLQLVTTRTRATAPFPNGQLSTHHWWSSNSCTLFQLVACAGETANLATRRIYHPQQQQQQQQQHPYHHHHKHNQHFGFSQHTIQACNYPQPASTARARPNSPRKRLWLRALGGPNWMLHPCSAEPMGSSRSHAL